MFLLLEISALTCWMFLKLQLIAKAPLFLQAIHVELSKLVKRQSGGNDTQEWRAKPAEMLGDNISPFLIPSKKKPYVSRSYGPSVLM